MRETLGSVLGSGRSPGEGNGPPVQYSHLDDLIARGAFWIRQASVCPGKHGTFVSLSLAVFRCVSGGLCSSMKITL